MSKGRQWKYDARQRKLMIESLENADQIPEDERYVLKRQSSYPLERGGIYSEMGADMTYEELSSYPNSSGELTQFEQQTQRKMISGLEVIGIMLMLFGVFILFSSPIWFPTITLGIALIARRHKLIGMMAIASIFTVIGFIFALYQLF